VGCLKNMNSLICDSLLSILLETRMIWIMMEGCMCRDHWIEVVLMPFLVLFMKVNKLETLHKVKFRGVCSQVRIPDEDFSSNLGLRYP